MLIIYIICGKVESKNITPFIYYNKIVSIDVTGDWCVTCKFNETMALDSIRIIRMFQIKNILMRGYFTSQDDEIYECLSYYNRVGIQFQVMFFLS